MSAQISIVIPTYKRPDQLKGCLEAIAELDYPSEKFEVIVVDDGSPEPVNHIVDAFATAGINVRLVRQENTGPGQARNRGASEASGQFLAFTDDDCRPSADWLTALEAALNDSANTGSIPGDTAIGGRTVNALDSDPYASASQLLVDYLYESYDRRSRKNQTASGAFFTSNNVLFPRQKYLEIGGFSSKFRQAAGEDREICDRWVASGGKLKYAPRAVVMHYHSMGFKRFVKQHFTYGRGAYHYHRLKAGGTGSPLDEGSAEFYTKILAYPFGKKSAHGSAYLSARLLVSQVANAFGFFFELKNKKNSPVHSDGDSVSPAGSASQALRVGAELEEPVRVPETVSKS